MQAQHGEFEIDIDNNVIKVTVQGAFNDVGAKALVTQLKSLLISLDKQPFAILANLLAFDGGTPEVFIMSDEFNAWLNDKNMVAKALVFTSPALIAIEQALVKSKTTQNIRYFEDENTALAWLNNQLRSAEAKSA